LFKTNPGLELIPDRPDLFYLLGDLIWEDSAVTITVPAFFISDMASVPHWLDAVPFLDRTGLSRRPGLAHDALYSLGREKGKDWCDRMLQAFCLAEGMNAFQAACYYRGVQMFGQSSWDSDARAGTYGAISGGDFFTEDAYRAWVKSGATIYSGVITTTGGAAA
jgi:hypothetical protein